MNASNLLKRGLMCGVLCSLAITMVCRADTIFLNDGSEINGTIMSENDSTVVIKTTRGVTKSVRRGDIDTITRDKPKAVAKKEEPVTPPATTPPAVTRIRPVAPVRPDVPDTTVTRPAAIGGGTPTAPAAVTSRPTTGVALAENPLPGFPENARRMSKRKEALLADALEAIKAGATKIEDPASAAAYSDIQALGSDVMPYLWAGVQNENAAVRVACMRMIGKLNGRTCTKRVIETFYMTMPEASAAATWNVPFVDEMMKTLISITGQTFIRVEARRNGVQDGLKKYIEWYKTTYKTLPRQIGEPELDPNDQNYDAKLDELRALKLTKREWPSGGDLPADFIAGPNKTAPEKEPTPIIVDAEREADRKFAKTIPTIPDDNSLKRPNDAKGGAVDDADALKRPSDQNPTNTPKKATRDTPSDVPSQNEDDKPNPLLRPQDIIRQQRKE